ncbi:hypothetical protein D3C87_1686370 [compost metagenome]
MTVDKLVFQKIAVEYEGDLPTRVVDGAENRDRSRHDTQIFKHFFRPAEGYAACRANRLVNAFQIDDRVLLNGQNEILILLVLHKKVLRVAARD